MGSGFWRLWAASTISNLGGGMSGAAFALLAAGLTRNPSLVAALTFAFTAPWLLFGLHGGALVDRLDRRRVMVSVNVARAVVVGMLALAVATEDVSLPLLYAVAFLLGASETLYDNAAQSLVPALVPRERLDAANGWLLTAERLTNEFIGPPIGGLLFAVAAWAAIASDAVGWALAAALLFGVRGRFRPSQAEAPPRASLTADVREGLVWLWHNPPLRALAATVALLGLVDTAWFAILVLFSIELLDVGPAGYGLLVAAGGLGAIMGSLLAAPLSRAYGRGGALVVSLVVAAAAQTGVGLSSTAVIAGVLLGVSGFAFGVWNVAAVSLRQALAPNWLLGRVHSAYRFLGVGASAVGALAGGVVADAFGLRAPFLIGAPLLVAAALAAGPTLRAVKV
jgi:MFS family permease